MFKTKNLWALQATITLRDFLTQTSPKLREFTQKTTQGTSLSTKKFRFFPRRLRVFPLVSSSSFVDQIKHWWLMFFFASECVGPRWNGNAQRNPISVWTPQGGSLFEVFFCFWKRCMFFSNKSRKHTQQKKTGGRWEVWRGLWS